MSANELDPAKQELTKIRDRYDAIIANFEELRKLNPEKYKQSALKEGLVLRVAKSAETILKYVCKSSNITVTAKDNKIGAPVFNDYIYHSYNKGLINDKLKSEFEQIRNIRNNSAHHDGAETFNLEHEELSIHKAEVIEDALTYITDWFFHTFLKEKYPDLSLKKSIPKDQTTPYQKYEPTPVTEEVKVTTNREKTKKPIQKTNKIRKKNIWFIFLSLAIIGILFLIFYTLNNGSVKGSPSTVTQKSAPIFEATSNTTPDLNSTIKVPEEKNSRKLAQKILQAYYDSLASNHFIATHFFANEVDEFKGLFQGTVEKDIEPKDITRLTSKSNFKVNPDFTLQIKNLILFNGKSPFQIWRYVCNSSELIENDNINKKIMIEFSFDAEYKFKSLKEDFINTENEGS